MVWCSGKERREEREEKREEGEQSRAERRKKEGRGRKQVTNIIIEGSYKVTIVAKDLPPHTTSNKAAAVWFPYLAYPADKIGRWASYTMEYLKKETLCPDSGVIVQKTVELYREEPAEPEWKVR